MADRVVVLSDGMIREIRPNEAKVPPSELSW
jgi:ABC-type sulfate/molybdate transport systems ATPase subunit